MAETLTGTVTKIKRTTKARQDGDGTFDILNITIDGIETGKYLNTDENGPTVVEGDQVTADVQPGQGKKGTYYKLLGLVNHGRSTTLGNKKKESIPEVNFKPVTSATKSEGTFIGSSYQTGTTTKDISMEVSGLLQAIISKHGLTEGTEIQLREALQLKRKVAKELEDKGSV